MSIDSRNSDSEAGAKITPDTMAERRDRLNFSGRKQLLLIRQNESAECGLACLAMISGHFGHHISLTELRHRFSTSLKGMTLERLIDISKGIGLNSRPVRAELGELARLRLPAILHWDLNHFVVLRSVRAKSMIIHDPAMGVRLLTHTQVSKHFTGVAIELSRGPSFRRKRADPPISMRELTGSVHGLSRSLLTIFGLAALLELCSLIAPQFMQVVVDQVLADNDDDLLAIVGISFSLLLVLQLAVSAARSWSITWLTSQFSLCWNGNVFQHLLTLPLGWFLRRHLGDIVSRFAAIATIQRTVTTRFVEVMMDGLMSAATITALLIYSPRLTLIIVGSVALYGLIRMLSYSVLQEANLGQIVIAARQQSQFMEALRGVQTIRLFNKEALRCSGYLNVTAEVLNSNISLQRINLFFASLNGLANGAQKIGVLWLGSSLALKGEFSAGMLMAFVAYSDQFVARSSSLVDYLIDLRLLRMHGERLADIVLAPGESHSVGTYVGPDPEPSLQIQQIAFRYADGEPWIIKDLSFSVVAGESVVIVGPSGCGKSTLLRLLLGLIDPSHGRITLGGIDMTHLGKGRFRRMTASVMQDDKLFSGSIADNISFFDELAQAEHIEEAARMAELHSDITGMPMGYHTLVGDMGSGLSGGQQQRILLARAFYRKASILFMDEATSHLDPAIERRITERLKASGTTRIFISHRPEVIAAADRVIELSTGRYCEVTA